MVWLPILLFVASLVGLVSSKVVYDMSLIIDECMQNKQISGDYTPFGKMINVGDLPVYEYDPPNNVKKKRLLVAAYDVWGLSYPNIKHVTDQMAIQHGGFRTVIPDFFRGDGWDADRDVNTRPEWLQRVGDWDSVVKPDLINVVQHYKNEGVEEFGILGFCFGGKVATLSAIELSDLFTANALIHPSLVTNDEAEAVKIPLYLMPASNDADMLPFYQVLREKFGGNTGHRRFDEVTHGFAGAHSNFSDPMIQSRVNEVIYTLGDFFHRNLDGTKQDRNNSSNIQPGHLLTLILIMSVFGLSRK